MKPLPFCPTLFFLFISLTLSAQQNYISEEDGLSNRHVTCILQDSRGLIWIGTANGLNLHEGYSFKNYFTFTKDISLSNARINCMVEDKAGNLWIGTNAGLNKISADRSINLKIESLKNVGIISLLELKNGNILAGTTIGKILEIDSLDQVKERYDDKREIGINGLQADASGRIWYFTNSEQMVYSLDLSGQTVRKFPESISSNYFLTGDSILASFQNISGLRVYDNQAHFHPDHFLDSLNKIYGKASFLYRDTRQTIWAGYPGGILLNINRTHHTVTNYSRYFRRAYFGSSILSMMEDHNGMMWVGTDGGLVKVIVPSPLFKKYLYNANPDDPAASISTRGIIEDGSGNICIASYKGLFVLSPKDGSTKKYWINDNPNVVAYRFAGEDDHVLLVSTIQEGLQYFDVQRGKFSSVLPPEKNSEKEVYALLKDSDGTIWAGTRRGLWFVDREKGVLTKYAAAALNEALISSRIFDIQEHPKGTLWIATSKGLLRITKSSGELKYYHHESSTALSSNEILSITPDDNVLWIGSHGGGLMKLNLEDEGISYFNTTEGMSSSIVYGIIRSGNYLWMSTGNGISSMELIGGRFKNYHEKDGLTDNEFNSASYFKASDGRIYFGGINGVNAFYPDELTEEKPKDKIILTSLRRGDTELLPQLSLSELPSITLPYHDRSLSVQFALTDYYHPMGNHFYYKIEGVDKDWVNIGSQNFLRFSQLPVGHYRLVVKGKNLSDQESVNQISIALNVEQIFYKTSWFIVTICVIIFGLIYFFFRMRLEQVKRTQSLRTKIASDLHDEVGSMLTRISILTEVLKYKNRDQEEISQIAVASRQATATMSDVLWSVDARNDKIGNLLDRMREHGDAMLRPLEISFEFESSLNEESPLEMQTRQSILLIFKEAIHNIAKHAGATAVNVTLKVQDNFLVMMIHDNGNGATAKSGSGQGLKNMNMRAEEMGGKLTVENGQGYTVTLRKPLS